MYSNSNSIKQYLRGIAGGLLVSLPMLYTMEVWWQGMVISPGKMIIYFIFSFFLLLGYNRLVGVHAGGYSFKEIFYSTVEELGLGVIVAFLVLLLIGRLPFADSTFEEIAGKVLMEAMTVAIGISVGRTQLGSEPSKQNKDPLVDATESQDVKKENVSLATDFILVLGSGLLIGSAVAPTDEIVMIAVEINDWKVFALTFISLMLTALILYFSSLNVSFRLMKQERIYQLLFNTCFTYCIALFSSGMLLWIYGRFDTAGFDVIVSEIIVLALPNTLGGSIARVIFKIQPLSDRQADEPKNTAERVIFASGALINSSALAYLVFLAVSYPLTEPLISARYRQEDQKTFPRRAVLEVKNSGNITARDVQVEAVLYKNGQLADQSGLNILFVPKRSSKRGWVVFRQPINKADSIAVHVLGYQHP